MFDGSMSSVAGNKIRIARRLGAKVAAGWIARPDGTPIMEETEVPEDFLMLPVGGTREIGSHKGYSLAVIVDILAGVLSGTGAGFLHPSDVSHHFTAWCVDAFRDVDAFKADMDALLRGLRECPPAPGAERVSTPAWPSRRPWPTAATRGIPYHRDVVEWFRRRCRERGVPCEI